MTRCMVGPWEDIRIRPPHLDIAFIQLPEHLPMPKPVSLRLDASSVDDMLVNIDGHVRHGDDGIEYDDVLTAQTVISDWDYIGNHSGYRAYWSNEFQVVAQPGDSGGPVYTVQSDGSARVYGVVSAATGPRSPSVDVSERCSVGFCVTFVVDFRLIGDWIAGVQDCAATSRCRSSVLKAQTLGYGINAHLFPSRCPTGEIPVGSFSVSFLAAERRTYLIGTSAPENVLMMLRPTDFQVAERGLVAEVTLPFGDANSWLALLHDNEIQSVVYPQDLQVIDSDIQYECVE